jgi:hypothetical protein
MFATMYDADTEYLSPTCWRNLCAVRRRHYLADAREAADQVWNETKRPVNIDQVREIVGSPPNGVDPRINGAVFAKWTPVYTLNSYRHVCHHRPICGFLPPMSFLRRTFTLAYLAFTR